MKELHCIYSMVLRPIRTYDALVWQSRNKLLTNNRAELSKLQTMASLCITEAMSCAPTAVVEMLLGSLLCIL